MRTMLLASVAMLCVGGTALAQTADSGPMSTKATHIDKADTGSVISPRLPSPNLGADASPDQYLAKAKSDTQAGRTGAAQEALERAETRLLDRSTTQSAANTPDPSPRIEKINGALHALASRDRNGAIQMIDAAMGDNAAGGASPMPMNGGTMPASALPSAKPPMAGGPTQPMNTPIAPGGTSGMTPATATGGTATGDGGAPTAVGGNGSGGGGLTGASPP